MFIPYLWALEQSICSFYLIMFMYSTINVFWIRLQRKLYSVKKTESMHIMVITSSGSVISWNHRNPPKITTRAAELSTTAGRLGCIHILFEYSNVRTIHSFGFRRKCIIRITHSSSFRRRLSECFVNAGVLRTGILYNAFVCHIQRMIHSNHSSIRLRGSPVLN